MKYSFIVLLDDIELLNTKLNYLNSIDNKEIIIVGPKEYEDNFDNYIVDDLTNIGKSINKGLKKVNGNYINISYASSYLEISNLDNIIDVNSKNIYRFNEKYSKEKTYDSIEINQNTDKKYEKLNDFSLIIDLYFFPS